MENQSRYDPSRKTVGAIYRDAVMNNHEDYIAVGDMNNEIRSSLVEDINDTIASDPFPKREWYLTVHEKKDLQMKNALLRRIVTSVYRPYPEDDTLVFRINEDRSEIRFCWCLPHFRDMHDAVKSRDFFDKHYIYMIEKWLENDLRPFGFIKVGMGDFWDVNPHWPFNKDIKMEAPRVKLLTV